MYKVCKKNCQFRYRDLNAITIDLHKHTFNMFSLQCKTATLYTFATVANGHDSFFSIDDQKTLRLREVEKVSYRHLIKSTATLKTEF